MELFCSEGGARWTFDVNTLGLRSFVTFYSIFCAFIVLSVFLLFLCVLLLLMSIIINEKNHEIAQMRFKTPPFFP